MSSASALPAPSVPAEDAAAAATRPPPSAITRVSAASITPAEFIERFVQTNQPVIIEDALQSWTDTLQQVRASAAGAAQAGAASDSPAAASWSVSQLSELLGSTPMRNVFVSSSQNQRRFKFFKQPRPAAAAAATASPPTAAASTSAVGASSSSAANVAQSVPSQVDPGLSRLSMPFDQFVALTAPSTGAASSALEQAERPAYYLYGEPMPQVLLPLFPTLPILSAVASPLTSTLLWVSPAPTVSPLHFDLNEGILCQLSGCKRVTLADPRCVAPLYPYPISHAHDRQSQLDDIHAPDPQRFPLASTVQLQTGLLTAGSLLYLPYGWWHQIESEDIALSVSMRWNPYEAALRQVAVGAQATRSLPLKARQAIQHQLWESLAVPAVVRDINERRWAELAESRAEVDTAALLEASA